MYPIDYLLRGCRRNPEGVALRHGPTTLSHGELAAAVDAFAARLRAADPAPGSRVGLSAFNTAAHVVALLGTLAAGKVWVPLNPRNGAAELGAMIDATRPSVIVADEANRGKVETPGARFLPLGDDAARPPAELPDPATLAARWHPYCPPLDAVQSIKFTSGSTGRPKGVTQSFRCWNAFIAGIAHAFAFRPDERFLVAAPVTHGTSCFLLPVLMEGGEIVLLDRPRPAEVLTAIGAHGITATYLTPTMIYMMLAAPELPRHRYGTLRHLIYSGAPMRPEQIRAAQAAFGPCLETSYGQAEAPQMISAMTAAEMTDPALHDSVGRPCLLSNVAIMGGDGRLLPAGEVGEIVVRGDILMSGYLDNPEATAAAMRDGWLRTGDLGAMDGAGYLRIRGRLKDVIITGGFNVFPADVEAALGAHPSVRECVVFGVPDEKWGEAVHAAVELDPEAPVAEAELVAFVKARLDGVKAPKRVHVVGELPRSAVGKVLRRETREAVIGGTDGG